MMLIKIVVFKCCIGVTITAWAMRGGTTTTQESVAQKLWLHCSRDIEKEWFTRSWSNPFLTDDDEQKNHTIVGYYGTHQDGTQCLHTWDIIDVTHQFEKQLGITEVKNNNHLRNLWKLRSKNVPVLEILKENSSMKVYTGDSHKQIYVFSWKKPKKELEWWILFNEST